MKFSVPISVKFDKDVGCGEVNIINKHPKGLKKDVGWAEFGCLDVGWAELKYMEEIAKVKGPRKCVGWAELSAVPRSVEPSYTVLKYENRIPKTLADTAAA